MAGFAHFLKTILTPLVAALILYFLLTLLLLPFIRRHRTRYSQYLPITSFPHLPSASGSAADAGNPQPVTWRTHLSDALYTLFAPSTWRRRRGRHNSIEHADELFDDEEGEGMVGFEPIGGRRREALDRRRGGEEVQRVGRELEEGFCDDSEDDESDEESASAVLGR